MNYWIKYLLKCALFSAIVNSIVLFCKDLVDYAIWMLLMAILIRLFIGGKNV